MEAITPMVIGERIREIREHKKLSQADVQNRCGLLRCYVSRVENGHTVPAVDTLEKFARALEVPLYQLVYDGDQPPPPPPTYEPNTDSDWESTGENARFMKKLRHSLSRMDDRRRKLVFAMAHHLASRNANE